MTLLNLIMITLLSMFSVDCKASGDNVNGSKVTEMVTAGDSLSTAFYLDLRERMDHLDDKICDTDKHVAVIQEKISSIESYIASKVDVLQTKIGNFETKLESVVLKLSVEIRDQLATYMKETKMQKIPDRKTNDDQGNGAHHSPHHSAVDVAASLADMTSKMESMNQTFINKVESEMLTLQTTASRLDDKLYTLSQKSDVCVRTVIEDRSDNCTDGVSSGLQGASASAWITILRRMDGRINFTRNWADYKSGFGDLGAEFWLGLEDIHQLTAVRTYRLRVVLTDFSGEVKFAEYSRFYIRGEVDNYRLHVSGYVPGSTAGDSMRGHNNAGFSTFDRDNDRHSSHCSVTYKGGWWYAGCHAVNPTGLYLEANTISTHGINWSGAYNDRRSFKRLEMSIRHD